jgi:hypothetical protein
MAGLPAGPVGSANSHISASGPQYLSHSAPLRIPLSGKPQACGSPDIDLVNCPHRPTSLVDAAISHAAALSPEIDSEVELPLINSRDIDVTNAASENTTKWRGSTRARMFPTGYHELSYRKHHEYVTVVVDHVRRA